MTRWASLLSFLVLAAPAAGAGWTPPFDVGPQVSDVAMAADGTTVYAGETEVDGAERAIVRVRPPGGPVGPVQKLGFAPTGIGRAPVLAAGPAGHVAVAWSEGTVLKAAILAPGATTFGGAVPVASNVDGTPALDVDSAGTAHLLWPAQSTNSKGQRFEHVVAGSVTGGTAGSAAAVVSRQQTTETAFQFTALDVAVGDSGAAIAGWSERATTFGEYHSSIATEVAVVLRAAGGAFGAPLSLDRAAKTGDFPSGEHVGLGSVAMNAAGAAAAVWGRSSADYDISLKARAGSAAGLGPVQDPAAGSGGQEQTFPVAAMDDGGGLHVAWVADVGGMNRPQHSLRAGEAFGPVQTLTHSGDQADLAAVAVAPAGDALVTWTTSGAGGARCGHGAAHAAPGGGFSAPVTLLTGHGSCGWPVADIRSGGDAVVRLVHGPSGEPAYEAAGLDASAPRIGDVQIPAAATAGAPAAFRASATDVWGPLRYEWRFGDGSTAFGDGVEHAFGESGDRTVTLTVTDAAGQSATAAGTVTVAGSGQIGGSTVVPDRVAPAITRLTLTRRGVRFRLSEAGRVVITVHRRSGKRFVRVRTLRRAGRAGLNRVAFRRARLRPGRYRATLRVTDAAGNASRPARVGFRARRAG